MFKLNSAMNSRNFFLHTKFLTSAFSLKDLPDDIGLEVAFCGRSNSGKSSVLNAITGNKKLAKTSKTPGRTQAINIFSIDPRNTQRIADLPGYGFAKVSKQIRKNWGKLIGLYLNTRTSLKGLVIIMDIRNPFKESDLTLIDWSLKTKIPLLVVLNKADKLSNKKVAQSVNKANLSLNGMGINGKALPFSSTRSTGLESLANELREWFNV